MTCEPSIDGSRNASAACVPKRSASGAAQPSRNPPDRPPPPPERPRAHGILDGCEEPLEALTGYVLGNVESECIHAAQPPHTVLGGDLPSGCSADKSVVGLV